MGLGQSEATRGPQVFHVLIYQSGSDQNGIPRFLTYTATSARRGMVTVGAASQTLNWSMDDRMKREWLFSREC